MHESERRRYIHRKLREEGYKLPTEICRDKGLSINTIAQWKRRFPDTFPKDRMGMYLPQEIDTWLELRATWTKDSRLVRANVEKP